jgi:hypothetical protein
MKKKCRPMARLCSVYLIAFTAYNGAIAKAYASLDPLMYKQKRKEFLPIPIIQHILKPILASKRQII